MRSIQGSARDLVVGRRLMHFAHLWKIIRTDLMVFRFTDHNRRVVFEDQAYDPAGALNPSALEASEGLGIDNRNTSGAIESSKISEADLEGGLFRGAEVQERLVDWRYPWAGALRSSVYFVRRTIHGERGWEWELEARAALLHQTIGERYTRTCRFTLGEPRCGIDLENLTSFVVTVSDVSSDDLNARVKIRIDNAGYKAGYAAGYADFGFLKFVSGSLVGLSLEVYKETRPSGNHIDFLLAEAAPRDIQVGDQFQVVAGCDRTFGTCKSKFNNAANFGGFPFLPGTDTIYRTLGAR